MREGNFDPKKIDLNKEKELSGLTAPGKEEGEYAEFTDDLIEKLPNAKVEQHMGYSKKLDERKKEEMESNPGKYMDGYHYDVYNLLNLQDEATEELPQDITEFVNEQLAKKFMREEGGKEYVRKLVQKLLDEFKKMDKRPHIKFLERQKKFFNLTD